MRKASYSQHPKAELALSESERYILRSASDGPVKRFAFCSAIFADALEGNSIQRG